MIYLCHLTGATPNRKSILLLCMPSLTLVPRKQKHFGNYTFDCNKIRPLYVLGSLCSRIDAEYKSKPPIQRDSLD